MNFMRLYAPLFWINLKARPFRSLETMKKNQKVQKPYLVSLTLIFAFSLCLQLTYLLWFNLQFAPFSQLPTPTDAATMTALAPPRSSVENYVEPSEVLLHEMTDEELMQRASMVTEVRDFPFQIVPKVAFLFLTKASVLLSPLWDKFFKGHEGLYNIYVHRSDSSSNWTMEPKHSVFHCRRIPSKDVHWGKVSMVEAERRLLANALLDFSNRRFVLLSEVCIPLFNFSVVYSYLINSKHSFVDSYDLGGPVARGRYRPEMYPNISIEEWRKGSQWFEMDRDLAMEVISDKTYFPVFQKHCDGSCYPDEHYLPTFVTARFAEKNSNRTLTFVDWSKGGPHPALYTSDDVTVEFLEKLRGESNCEYNGRTNQTCHLFARKFTPQALNRLLTIAPRIMQFNP